jgi:hypothetical protein
MRSKDEKEMMRPGQAQWELVTIYHITMHISKYEKLNTYAVNGLLKIFFSCVHIVL